jgi:predicted DNA-binding transcriptional regulator YafY
VEEMQIRLEDTFKLKGNLDTVVGFEQNPYLKGLNYFTSLFEAMQNQKVLNIKYQGFKQALPTEMSISPWYLKQYNNRWFLFGWNMERETLTNLAIDRINALTTSDAPYVENKQIDFEEYFEDVVGVTVNSRAETEKVLIKISRDLWPYIESKPLHGSQKTKERNDASVIIELNVQLNYELESLLFSFKDGLEILEPTHLRIRFKEIAESLNQKYD